MAFPLVSHRFACLTLQNFKIALYFIFSSDLIHIFLLLFVLYEIIYKINFFLISSSFNFFICHIWLPLFWLLFVLFEIIFKIEFCLRFHPSLFFFLSDLIFILLIDFFYFDNFFKMIFFTFSYFNIKLIENWTSWLSTSLGFHGLWIWDINSSLEDSYEFACF